MNDNGQLPERVSKAEGIEKFGFWRNGVQFREIDGKVRRQMAYTTEYGERGYVYTLQREGQKLFLVHDYDFPLNDRKVESWRKLRFS